MAAQSANRPTDDGNTGRPCLACKNCKDGFAQHVWRKSCRNCFCSREDHDLSVSGQQSNGTSRQGLNGRIALNTIVRRPLKPEENKVEISRTGKKWVRPPPVIPEKPKPEIQRTGKKWSRPDSGSSEDKASVGQGATSSAKQDESTDPAGGDLLVNLPVSQASSDTVNLPPLDELPSPPVEEDLPPPPPPGDDDFGLDDALADIMQTVDSFGKKPKPSTNDIEPKGASESMPDETSLVASSGVSDAAQDVVASNKWSWVPEGLSNEQVEQFMAALPEDVRPTNDHEDIQRRTRLQMKQRPPHDSDAAECNPMSKEDQEQLEALVKEREKQRGTGVVRESESGKSCARCQKEIQGGELTVHAEQVPGKVWHPGCFKCKTCEQFLVDLDYYYQGDDVYCGRHYAELSMPRCAGCDELILSGTYTKAQDKSWHTNHFCCIRCDKPLAVDIQREEYANHEGQVVCMACYNTSLAKTCMSCGELMGPGEEQLAHDGHFWHAKCFSCSQCKTDLDPNHFLVSAGEIFCETCYTEKFSDACATCQQPIKPGEQAFTFAGKKVHEKCFACVSCNGPLAGVEFFDHSSGILCGACYHGKHSTKCDACNQPLSPEGGLNYDDKTYHSKCFICAKCNVDIATGKFVSRDNDFFCENCYLSGIAPQCVACSKAITSSGESKSYTSHEGKTWHDDCFQCEQCAKPLIGASFVYRGGKLKCMPCTPSN